MGIGEKFSYLAFDIAPTDLGAAMAGLSVLRCAGANVTVPHKRAVLEHCSMIDDDARRIGAANVLVASAAGFSAHNTDAPAAARALAEHGVAMANKHAVIIGSGGSARAVAVGLAREGLRELSVLARNVSDAHAVIRTTSGLGLSDAQVYGWTETDAQRCLSRADIIVHCTPLGMRQRAADVLDNQRDAHAQNAYQSLVSWLDFANPHTAAMDLVYSPVRTAWLQRAQSRGLLPIDGLLMLAHQGSLALTRWCANSPSVAILRQFLDGDPTAS